MGRDDFVRDPWLEEAKREIEEKYGDRVTEITKKKQLTKYGKNDSVDTNEQTVWERGGVETYPTSNSIINISSSNNSDLQDVIIEGHTIDSGSDLTFVEQTATLSGQSVISLTTPLYRATRLYNNGSVDFNGTVYVYEDDTVSSGVPQTASKIHIQSDGTNNQSLKCATALSSTDYWIITGLTVGINRNATTTAADFKIQIREQGKVFRTKYYTTCSNTSGALHIDFKPYLIAPKNSDVRVQVIGTAACQGSATIHGILANVS